ncbi:MAG: polysaccharide deacetylase family protein [Patescibacteria group bacterium]
MKKQTIGIFVIVLILATFFAIKSFWYVSGQEISSKKEILQHEPVITYSPEYFENMKRGSNSTKVINPRITKYQEYISHINNGKKIVPVVMYHYIEYFVDPHDTTKQKLNVMASMFEYQLASWKSSGYRTLFAKEMEKILDDDHYIHGRDVVLTFDDGYEDFYTIVFPLLKKYKMKGTVYVISNFVGRYGFLKKEQLIEMSKSGLVEIGGHTQNHAYLKGLKSEYIQTEVIDGKSDIEKMIGGKIETFAYPFGAFSDEAETIVGKAGYVIAFTTVPGIAHSPQEKLLLPRIRPFQINYQNIDASLAQIYSQYK